MSGEQALLYAIATQDLSWEEENREAYDVSSLRDEFRSALYSDRGLELLNAKKND